MASHLSLPLTADIEQKITATPQGIVGLAIDSGAIALAMRLVGNPAESQATAA